mgnify:CR=1 FL=1
MKRILVIAPHPDDETLGLVVTISTFISQGDELNVLTISCHLPPLYSQEEYAITKKEALTSYKSSARYRKKNK